MDIEITPVAQHIAAVAEGGRELEVVVGPTQTFTPSYGCAEDGHRLVVIEHGIIVVISGIVHTIAGVEQCVVAVERVVAVVTGDVGLLGVEDSEVQAVGALAAKPVGAVVCTQRTVVGAVGLETKSQLLTVAVWQYATMELVLAKEIADGEVVELDTDLSDDTRLSPSE